MSAQSSSGSKLLLTPEFFEECIRLGIYNCQNPSGNPRRQLHSEYQLMFNELQKYLKSEPLRALIFVQVPPSAEQPYPKPAPLVVEPAKSRDAQESGELRFRVDLEVLGSGGYAWVSNLDKVIKTDVQGNILEIKDAQKVFKLFRPNAPRQSDSLNVNHELDRYTALTREQSFKRVFLQSTSKVRKTQDDQGLIISKISGETLNVFARKHEVEELSDAGRVMLMYQLLSDLVRVHRLGYIHGDIKNLNIMVNLDRVRVQLIDFGLAQQIIDPEFENELSKTIDNKELAGCLWTVVGFGYLNTDKKTWKAVLDGIHPESVQMLKKDYPMILNIIQKLWDSPESPEKVGYYDAESALKEILPHVQANLVVFPEEMELSEDFFVSFLSDIQARIDFVFEIATQLPEDPDKDLKLYFLYELQTLLCMPKGADDNEDFLDRRIHEIEKFLLGKGEALERFGFTDLAQRVVQGLHLQILLWPYGHPEQSPLEIEYEGRLQTLERAIASDMTDSSAQKEALQAFESELSEDPADLTMLMHIKIKNLDRLCWIGGVAEKKENEFSQELSECIVQQMRAIEEYLGPRCLEMIQGLEDPKIGEQPEVLEAILSTLCEVSDFTRGRETELLEDLTGCSKEIAGCLNLLLDLHFKNPRDERHLESIHKIARLLNQMGSELSCSADLPEKLGRFNELFSHSTATAALMEEGKLAPEPVKLVRAASVPLGSVAGGGRRPSTSDDHHPRQV